MSAPAFNFRLVHGWGGSYAVPLTAEARQYVQEQEAFEDYQPYVVDFEGDLACDHKDGLDMARMIRDAGFTFANMEQLA